MQVHGHSRYCESTGGDYLDFIDVTDLPNDRAFIAVGDVMGHGIGSALLMATARAAVRTSAAVGQESLGQMMGRVNNVLARDARHGLFMTMLLLIIDRHDGTVRWASAGHDPAVIYDPAADRFIDLEGAELPLGVDENIIYPEFQHIGLADGQILFVGTDGMWEARNAAEEEFGKQRINEMIRANASATADDIAAALRRAHDDFVGSARIRDDVTFVIVKFTPMTDASPSKSVVFIASGI
jgi:sigma-B regulation protein RsbU (phosphoserine phosphatase)